MVCDCTTLLLSTKDNKEDNYEEHINSEGDNEKHTVNVTTKPRIHYKDLDHHIDVVLINLHNHINIKQMQKTITYHQKYKKKAPLSMSHMFKNYTHIHIIDYVFLNN